MARPSYSEDERQQIEGEIREAALRCFGRVGYRAASMRSIAAELGWSAPALYRYYENKDALLAAVRAEGFLDLGGVLAELRSQSGPSRERIRAALVAYLTFARERSDLYRLMYELDQGGIAEHEEVAANRRNAFAQAENLAADLLDEMGVSGDPNRIAHLFWISAHGLAALAVASQLDLGQDYEDLVEPVLRMILGEDLLSAAS